MMYSDPESERDDRSGVTSPDDDPQGRGSGEGQPADRRRQVESDRQAERNESASKEG